MSTILAADSPSVATTRCAGCGPRPSWWQRALDRVRGWFGAERLMMVPVAEIADNPYQPREYVLEELQESLKASIRSHGIIVPIIVSESARGLTLVAGQRRLKAARDLGFEHVPAIVRKLSPKQVMEMSYLENLHRVDLTRVDQVIMFDRIRRKYPNLTEAELAATMGLKAEEISRARAFLDLPVPVQEALRAGMISEEHASIVAQIDDPEEQLEVIELVYADKLDLERTRELVSRMLRREAPYVSSDDGVHFHSPTCAYAGLIPQNRMLKYWSKREPVKRGKIPCMNCL
jgi:ParB family chromosome partitioning protein